MGGPVPNGFTDSWYLTTERRLERLQAQTESQAAELVAIHRTLDRIQERMVMFGNRLAQVAIVAVIAALAIPAAVEVWTVAASGSGTQLAPQRQGAP